MHCDVFRANCGPRPNFIPKTFANLIEPKMWSLCMARNGGPSVEVRTHSWPRPTVGHAIHNQANYRSTVSPEQYGVVLTLFTALFENLRGSVQSIQLRIEDLFVFAKVVPPAGPACLSPSWGVRPAGGRANPWWRPALLLPPDRGLPHRSILQSGPICHRWEVGPGKGTTYTP